MVDSLRRYYIEKAKQSLKVGDIVQIIHLPGIRDSPRCRIDSISKDGLAVIVGIDSSYWASVSILYLSPQ